MSDGMETIQIRVDRALLDWIDQKAQEDDRSRSSFIRKTLGRARDAEQGNHPLPSQATSSSRC